jgi:hypothetical protein
MYKNKKGLDFSKPFDFERKTRLEPTLRAGIFANYIYTPDPWKGRFGVARPKPRTFNGKRQPIGCLSLR